MEGSRTMRCRSIGMLTVTLGVPLLAVFWPLLTGVGKDSLGGSAGPNAALAQTSSPRGADARPGPVAVRPVDPFRQSRFGRIDCFTGRDARGRRSLRAGGHRPKVGRGQSRG